MGWLDSLRSWVSGSPPATPQPTSPQPAAPQPPAAQPPAAQPPAAQPPAAQPPAAQPPVAQAGSPQPAAPTLALPPAPQTPQQAQSKLDSAQADAAARLNPTPPEGDKLHCDDKTPKEPCDLSVFEVTEKRQKSDFEWSLPEFSDRLKTALGLSPAPREKSDEAPTERGYPAKYQFGPAPDAKTGVLKNGSTLEMVALGAQETKKTTVALEVRTDFKFCGATLHHPEIQVKSPDGTWDRQQQSTRHSLTVYRPTRAYDKLPAGFSGLLGYFWMLSGSAAVYEAHAIVCGSRKPAAAVGSQMCWIKVYPADQYEFTVTLPPVFKIGYERYSGRGSQKGVSSSELTTALDLPGYRHESSDGEKNDDASGTYSSTFSSSTQSRGERQSESTTYSSKGGKMSTTVTKGATVDGLQGSRESKLDWESGEVKHEIELGPEEIKTQIKIEFKHNGTSLDVLDWITSTLKLMRGFSETINEIYKTIEDWKPKVGWFFTFDMTFFAGSFGAVWGAREWTDFRVFRALEVTAQLEIIRATVSLAFGVDAQVKGVGLVAKVHGDITGAVSVKGSLSRASPDAVEVKPASFEGAITGTLGFEGSVITKGWFLLEGTVDAGISVEGSLKADDKHLGAHVEKVMWKGITAKGKVNVALIGSKDATIKLMDPRKLGGPFDFP